MKVASIKPSFFDGRYYRPGEVFELPEGSIPSKAMKVVDDSSQAKSEKAEAPAAKKSRRRAVPVEPETLSEATPFFDDELKA
jgi:hypothetical protein